KLDGGIANWVRSQASALAEQYLTEYGDEIELIICNNDDMALGVVDVVEKLGLNFSNIVGIDGTPQGLEAVKNGKMLGTVVIGYSEHAQMIVDMTLALYHNLDLNEISNIGPDRTLRAPLYIVSKSDFE
ncbi:MAG: substrate-binding domain-containing protein, partial [Oscillospiraceae bacterium]